METEQHIVKRPNETIGIVPNGKHRITHLVRRLYSVILLFSQQQGEKEEYSAVLSQMLAVANSSGSNRTQVKEILRDIRAIGVDWNTREGDRSVWKNVGLIEEPGLIDGKGTPTIVTWKLPKIIQSRLLDPRGFFTKISLEMMTRLRSGASIALYEICCQYASNDHGKGEGGLTNRGSIAEWMPRLTGSRKADYEYKFLKRDVVMTAIQEINEITDLRVELIEHKIGRKVGGIQFRVFRKQLADLILPVLQGELVKTKGLGSRKPGIAAVTLATPADLKTASSMVRMAAIGVPKLVAERLHKLHSPDYLERHLNYVEARIQNTVSAPLLNKVAFLQKAMNHGYADASLVPVVRAVAQPVPPLDLPEEMELRQQALTVRAEVWLRFQAMANEAEKNALITEFLQQGSTTIKTFYKKNGVNNMIVKVSMTDWLIDIKHF